MRPTHSLRLLAPALVAAGLLAACASPQEPARSGRKHAKAPVVVATPMPGAPATAGGSGTFSPPPSADEPDSVIYYDPDTYTVKDSYRPMLQAYARRLQANPGLRLRIDGHTDDNGPADYNLELARVRAQMVMKELTALGAPPSQLQIVGHGKDQPKARGATLQSQAANRRVELSYR